MNNTASCGMVWKVHVANLIQEIIENGGPAVNVTRQPLKLLRAILVQVGERASELNDPKLNALMCRLAIYAISDPKSPDYNKELTEKIIGEAYP